MQKNNNTHMVRAKARKITAGHWFMGIALLIILCMFFIDLCFEFWGPSNILQNYFRNELMKSGIEFKAEKIKLSLFRGVKLIKAELREGTDETAPSLTADSIDVSFAWSEILALNLQMKKFSISNACLSIPIFPESGKEGIGDRVVLENFNASITKTKNTVMIEKAEGTLHRIKLHFSGKIENILMRNLSIPQIKPQAASGKKAVTVTHRKRFSLTSLISSIPVTNREDLMKNLYKIDRRNFNENPELSMTIALDAGNFKKCSAEVSLKIPEFTYGKMNIKQIIGKVSLKDSRIHLDTLRINLPDEQYCEIQGHGDLAGTKVTGTAKGKASIDEIMLFLDDKSKSTIKRHFDFKNSYINFEASLSNFSLSTGQYQGELNVQIPQVEVNSIPLQEIDASLYVKDGELKGKLNHSRLPDNGTLAGNFKFSNRLFSIDFNGTAMPAALLPVLNEKAQKFIAKNIDFTNQPPMNFNGMIEHNISDKKNFSGNADISLPSMKIRGTSFTEIKMKLEFSRDFLKAKSVTASIGDEGTEIKGDFDFLMNENVFSASIFCKGNPCAAAVLLENEHRGFLQKFTGEIKWPTDKKKIEASLDLHYQWKNNPYYYLSGNIVLSDFSYRNIPFEYGATRFFIDSDNTIILPGIILENQDGEANITVACKGNGSTVKDKNKPSDTQKNKDGLMQFSLKSTIKGEDLIRIFYSKWQNEYLSLPQPIAVNAKGFIDSANPENTRFTAVLDNAKCKWNKTPISNIDATIIYENEALAIKNATADFCTGIMKFDYDFNFRENSGNIELDFNGADFKKLLTYYGIDYKNISEKGNLAGKLKSTIGYDAEKKLLMNGNGEILLTNADLWSVPFFGNFLNLMGNTWGINKFGNVSELKAEFILDGNRLKTKSVKTNGNIVALDGRGTYYWDANSYDFYVRSELLRHLLPFKVFSYIFSPVTWMMEARIHGQGDKFEWN